MERWFIYYKLPLEQAAGVLAAVRDLQSRLAADAGRCRPRAAQAADEDGTATLMEIYEPIADPERFARAMDAAVAGECANVCPARSAPPRTVRRRLSA